MKLKYFTKLSIVVSLILSATAIAAAQNGPTSRSVTSDDFGAQRPSKPRPPRTKYVKPKSYKYNHSRTDKNVVRWGKKVAPPTVAANLPIKVTDIGITLWKLRPPRSKEVGHLLPVRDETDTVRMWLAERVPTDTIFKVGDKIRFAIESSDSGYLYVIDRETFADGTYGEPLLVFPASPDEDNAIGPGMLFDLPDQREDNPYFNLQVVKSGGAEMTGDLLTVIISPKPLSIFKPDEKGYVKNSDDLVALEAAAEVEIFSRTDSDNKVFSKVEAEATCGQKTRGLVREKSTDKPCGNLSRQLNREEAKPQAIYRTKVPAGQPAVAFVRLAVRP